MMVKKNLEPHRLSIANFVDLNETNKKLIEGDLPRSLLWDTGGSQNAKIPPPPPKYLSKNTSKIKLQKQIFSDDL
jgi:hypothetical protein